MGDNTNLPLKKSIADGISVKCLGKLNKEFISKYVDGIILVDEQSIEYSIKTLLMEDKILVEGAGAVAFAAVHNNLLPDQNNLENIVCICSGGNIDIDITLN